MDMGTTRSAKNSTEGPATPTTIDTRPRRRANIEIMAAEAFDFCISLRVALASPEDEFTDFDVGQKWIETARSHCAERDAAARATLGLYVGDDYRESLGVTLISLVSRCTEPRTVPNFLNWLAKQPPMQLVSVLLEQVGVGPDWPDLLAAAVAAPADEASLKPVLKRFDKEKWPTVRAVLTAPDETQRRLVAALWVWHEAVFKQEIARIMPMVQREQAALERLRREKPFHGFVDAAMRGVQWERTEVDRIVFAPSYFARPAVFYHLWDDVLTFCLPVDDTRVDSLSAKRDPDTPTADLLHYFEALGDPTRLRILHLLSGKQMYLTEMADALNLTKATTKHHMVKLRAAGLVTLHDRGRLTYYEIRSDIARHARELLAGYLGATRPSAPVESLE